MCKLPLMQKMGFAGKYSRRISEHLEIDLDDVPPLYKHVITVFHATNFASFVCLRFWNKNG